MTGTDNGEQPPTGEQPPVVPPLPDKPVRPDESKMSILRKVGYGLLVVAVLAALVPIIGLASDDSGPPARTAAGPSAQKTTEKPTTTTKSSKKPAKALPSRKPKSSKARKSTPAAEEGPEINSENNERADTEITRSKVVVGGIAAGLLVIVIWGRRVRSVRRKKLAKQAKGG